MFLNRSVRASYFPRIQGSLDGCSLFTPDCQEVIAA